MNTFQQVFTQTIMLFSLATTCGVLLHDTHIDKAFMTVVHSPQANDDSRPDMAVRLRSGSNLHPHAEELSMNKGGDRNYRKAPRSRDRKNTINQKRLVRGYHGEGYCMPLAGEWV